MGAGNEAEPRLCISAYRSLEMPLVDVGHKRFPVQSPNRSGRKCNCPWGCKSERELTIGERRGVLAQVDSSCPRQPAGAKGLDRGYHHQASDD